MCPRRGRGIIPLRFLTDPALSRAVTFTVRFVNFVLRPPSEGGPPPLRQRVGNSVDTPQVTQASSQITHLTGTTDDRYRRTKEELHVCRHALQLQARLIYVMVHSPEFLGDAVTGHRVEVELGLRGLEIKGLDRFRV